MISAFVDTNILIELYRSNKAAHVWLAAQTDLAITSIVWLEFMEGAPSKAGQLRSAEIVEPFELVYLTEADQRWAMIQVLTYRFSHGLKLKDSLIASVCHRLQLPLYTKNIKDFVPIIGTQLAIKPY